MSKVADYQQEIRDAIEYYERHMERLMGCAERQRHHMNYSGEAETRFVINCTATALTALRAQIEPGEPCDICCDPSIIYAAFVLDDHSIPVNHCPNCGRRIDLIPSKSTQSGAIRSARGDDE